MQHSVEGSGPLSAAVVGSGGISKEHLAFLSGRSQLVEGWADRIDLVAVCDLSPVSAEYARDTYGAGRAYTDVATMLAEARPDVVHILTPPSTHVPLATAALRSGSHVICEKPITADGAQLDQLLAVADDSGRHLIESHNYRFNRGTEELKALIDSGRLGTVREVEVRIALPVTDPAGRFGDPNLPSPIHRMPAGVIHDFVTHMAYLGLHLGGPLTVEHVAAAWNNHSENPLFRYDNLDAVVIGRSATGPVHLHLRFDAESKPDTMALRVHGTEGWAETDLYQPNMRLVAARAGGGQLSPIVNHLANGAALVRDGLGNVGRKIMQQTPYHGLHRMLALTYEALENGTELPITPDDMRATAALIDAIVDDKARF